MGCRADAKDECHTACIRMNQLTAAVLVLCVASCWFASDVLKVVRRRLAERVADWLLPPSQAITFRIAVVLAHVARRLAPKARAYKAFISASTGVEHLHTSFPYLIRRELGVDYYMSEWSSPEAAIGELEADLRSGTRTLAPVRFLWPVLRYAITLRLRNWRATASCLPRQTVFALLWFVVRTPVPPLRIAFFTIELSRFFYYLLVWYLKALVTPIYVEEVRRGQEHWATRKGMTPKPGSTVARTRRLSG